MKHRTRIFPVISLLMLAGLPACATLPESPAPTAAAMDPINRESSIPADAVKMSPETDQNPPLLVSDEFEPPVPVPGAINTAGAEDGVFIMPDGHTMYFFFTPDANVPVEKQILDGVTGLYVSQKADDLWGEPERIILQDPGMLAMDGCEFVQDDTMWFCSAREGYTDVHWFTAEYVDGSWRKWQNTDFDPAYQVGELHFSHDWTELYFGSEMPGGSGGLDIWLASLVDGNLQQPVNLDALNTPDSEGWPALNPAADELWITRNWGIWRSKLVNGGWQESELIVSPLAGEASIDQDGNLYFIHHYYVDGRMIEADIYVAYRK